MAKTRRVKNLPKPLAAYRLGLLSRTLELWRPLFFEMPHYEWETPGGVLLTFEQMLEAVETLAGVIHVNVYKDFRSVLENQCNLWRAIVSASWQRSNSEEALRDDPIDSEKALRDDPIDSEEPLQDDPIEMAIKAGSPNVSKFADSALQEGSALKVLLDLGAAIGEYTVQVMDLEPSDALPSLGKIVSLSRSVPQEVASRVPVLQAVASKVLTDLSPRALLANVLKSTGRTPSYENFGAQHDVFVTGQLAMSLDFAIQEELEAKVGAQPVKPRWDKITGQLWIGDEEVRKVAPQAENGIELLDAFQTAEWPDWIKNPFNKPNDTEFVDYHDLLRDTVKTLNKGLKKMRFLCGQNCEQVMWLFR